MSKSAPRRFVSRGGEKLAAALAEFGVDVAGAVCLDIGSHAGGFVDCLLQNGARRVYAVDTGYGVLDYRLRRDGRVVVNERTNALHFTAPELCQLVTIDAGWTPQQLILPAALRSLAPGGHVISLLKPQYEAPPQWRARGVVMSEHMDELLTKCRGEVEKSGWLIEREMPSPLKGHGGNVEFLWLLRRKSEAS